MSPNPKQLVVEIEKQRETYFKIVGSRESLLLLAHDLSAAAQELPEPLTRSQHMRLAGWEQHRLEAWEAGFFFQAEPDVAAYLEKRRASRSRSLRWVHPVLGVIGVALALIGLRTVWLWIF